MWRGYLRYAARERRYLRYAAFFYMARVTTRAYTHWGGHTGPPLPRVNAAICDTRRLYLFHLDFAGKCHAFSVPQTNRVFLYTTAVFKE